MYCNMQIPGTSLVHPSYIQASAGALLHQRAQLALQASATNRLLTEKYYMKHQKSIEIQPESNIIPDIVAWSSSNPSI